MWWTGTEKYEKKVTENYFNNANSVVERITHVFVLKSINSLCVLHVCYEMDVNQALPVKVFLYQFEEGPGNVFLLFTQAPV